MMNQVDELVVLLQEYARVAAADRCVNSSAKVGLQAVEILRAALPDPEKLEEAAKLLEIDPGKGGWLANELKAMAKNIRSVY